MMANLFKFLVYIKQNCCVAFNANLNDQNILINRVKEESKIVKVMINQKEIENNNVSKINNSNANIIPETKVPSFSNSNSKAQEVKEDRSSSQHKHKKNKSKFGVSY